MPVVPVTSDTGPAVFSDIGTLSYNAVTFSVLQYTTIKANVVQDDAKRTTKWIETILSVVGYVTLNEGAATTDSAFVALRQRLTVHGQSLRYVGKGYGDLIVNVPGQGVQDAAYGPVPKMISFKPMGGSRSAQIEWEVTVHIPELTTQPQAVAQYNYEAAITYDDEGYSQVSIRGVLEIQATRVPNSRDIQAFVDAQRREWTNIVFDLSRFRVVRRNFNVSRDKRTLDWEFMAEELPPMDLPFGATKARGTMSVSPFRPFGGGRMVLYGTCWTCTLKATYTIRKDFPPRLAAINFFSLLQFRMRSSANGAFPALFPAAAAPPGGGQQSEAIQQVIAALAQNQQRALALLQDMRFDEGLYLDSKTMTWEATWILFTTFRTLLEASGVWRWPEPQPPEPGSLEWLQAVANGTQNRPQTWASSMENISGWKSWLHNLLVEQADVIVDMGGGGPPVAGVPTVNPLFGNQ